VSDICGPLKEVCSLPQNDPIIRQASLYNFALILVSAISGLRNFGNEKTIFQRESETGLSTISYFITKDISCLPTILLIPLSMLSLYFSMAQQRGNC
jgi:hypothetical protein